MAAEVVGTPDFLHKKVTVRVREIELTFYSISGKLTPKARVNVGGGRSTHLSDSEYREAVRIAGYALRSHREAA